MTPDEKQALLQAVNLLVNSPDAHALFATFEAVWPVAVDHPVALTGAAAALNPLTELRRQDPPAYMRVVDLVESRRQALGYEPLRPEPGGYDRVEYMRQFMEQKRERQRTAVEIENLLRPPKDKLIGNARLEFMRRQSERWKDALDAFLQRAKEANGGKMSKDKIDQVRTQFWSGVDEDLETRLAAAKAGQLKVGLSPDVELQALTEALKR